MADRRRKPPRKDRRGVAPLTAAVVFLVIAIVAVYLGFTKHVPFTHGFRVKAVVESANSLRKASFVRIAGVQVGQVKKVEPFGDGKMAIITMELKKNGLPLHKNATLTIRPRIFLEGNFFVDLKPGTPSSPVLHDGDTIPVTQTSDPVQLDQVLTALQSDTRANLQDLLKGYGGALQQHPTPASDVDQDPDVKGLTGAQALRESTKQAPEALKTTSQVNEALLGLEPHDLSHIIASVAKVSTALESREVQLQDLVTNFNITMQATASESANLEAGLEELSPTLDAGNRALASLNRAFPPTRAFAREILPGVHESAATIDASFPFIKQTKALLGPDELQGVARELRPTIRSTSKLIDDTTKLLPQVDLVQKCVSQVVLPSGDVKVVDPVSGQSANVENYKEFWYALVGIAGEGQNFDGNGQYVRFQPGGGLDTVSTGTSNLAAEKLLGQAASPPVATAPAYPGRRPAYHPEVPCYKSGPTTSAMVNGPAAKGNTVNVTGVRPPNTSALQNILSDTLDLLPALPSVPGLGELPLSRKHTATGRQANGSSAATPRTGSGGSSPSSSSSSSSGGGSTATTPATPSSSAAPSAPSSSATPSAPSSTPAPSSSASSQPSVVQQLLGSLNPLRGGG